VTHFYSHNTPLLRTQSNLSLW